jgi:hypothetical protein
MLERDQLVVPRPGFIFNRIKVVLDPDGGAEGTALIPFRTHASGSFSFASNTDV